ncbi:MAG: MotA/TolQ/ExbB proton channel family protein [Calditrichaeota bacterium]|nr:MAG: MotA/TolQ/ExbB proton channel family protein [Calditrichota bacterium]
MELNIVDTLRSSFTMIILIACSVVALTFIFERWLFYKHTSIDADRFFIKLKDAFRNEGLEKAISVCNSSLSPLAAVVKSGLEEANSGSNAAAEIMDAMAIEQRTKLEKNLTILGTLGNIAPLIGLFGTVVGIIRAFHSLSVSGSAGPSVVSAGIAEALVTTAAGLVVAVPAVVFYNYFLRRVDTVMNEIESVSRKVMVMMGFNV